MEELNFEKPVFKIADYIENNNYGKFELEPLERGFGTTIGNALRRVMLSNMPGSAIVAVRIDGVAHEFQTIDGVVEDVTTIVLNLKSVVLKKNVEGVKTLKLCSDIEGVVTAGDIICDGDIEVINPNQEIATIAKGGKLDMEFIVASGRGYVPANENTKYVENAKLGFIPIDALYSPIERISYEVESARVGQDANYDKLIMNVNTNGSLKPQDAMALGARILIEHLNIVSNLNEMTNNLCIMSTKEEDSSNKKLDIKIKDLDFSARTYNCLEKEEINTLGDLVSRSVNDLNKIRNLGKKSLKEIHDKVIDMGLKFRDQD